MNPQPVVDYRHRVPAHLAGAGRVEHGGAYSQAVGELEQQRGAICRNLRMLKRRKSALIAELSKRGYAVVDEPGRRIVKEELARGGSALPWIDKIAFARRAITMALADWAAAYSLNGWVFLDRGLIDAAAALQQLTGKPALVTLGQANRYHRRVFLTPPWPEIYRTDGERRHGLDVALAEYSRLLRTYPSLGYEISILPKVSVLERADFVLRTLET